MRTVAVLVGSLRRESVNMKLARALAKLAHSRLEFRFIEIGDVPLYNEDLWADAPPAVLRMKSEVKVCDAVLMISPEYNRGVAAVLKNAFDWGTRPSGQNVWEGKPGAIGGAASGPIGTAVAQSQLRHSLTILGVFVMGRPELYFQFRPGAIDSDSNITDDATRIMLTNWTEQFVNWIDHFLARS